MPESEIIERGAVERPSETGFVEETNAALLQGGFNPSDVLVQVLRRPDEAINKRLERTLMGWTAAGIGYQPLEDPFGGWIDVARNWQTILFRKAKTFKYLLMIDADVSVPVETPYLMARHDLPIVTGVVPGYNEGFGLFLCIVRKGADGRERFPTLNSTKVVPGRGLVECERAGAGCLLVRRDVIEAMWEDFDRSQDMLRRGRAVDLEILRASLEASAPRFSALDLEALRYRIERSNWEEDITGSPFAIPESVRNRAAELGQMPLGEDICFSKRARKLGFTIHADMEVRGLHQKTMLLGWPRECVDEGLDAKDWQMSAFDMPVEP